LTLKLLVASGVAALALLVLDGFWLWLMAPTYRRLLGGAMIDTIRLVPAIAFYVLYIIGVVVLLVQPRRLRHLCPDQLCDLEGL
jgi:uncharacterized membrane protein